jgi:hypothetical protein
MWRHLVVTPRFSSDPDFNYEIFLNNIAIGGARFSTSDV